MVATPNGLHIPAELRDETAWLCWRSETRKNGPTKVPYSARTHRHASSTDPTTWATFDEANLERVRHKPAYSGIGRAITAPRVGVDLDHCRDPETGVIAAWALRIVRLLDSYTEISPSGTGVHIWVLGDWTAGWNNKRGLVDGVKVGVEVYRQGKYFTFTGERLADTPLAVNERTAQLQQLASHPITFDGSASHTLTATVEQVSFADDAVLSRMFACSIGDDIRRVWNNTDGANASDGDWALIDHLLYWTEGDTAQTDRLFRRSDRLRPKWDESHFAGKVSYGEGSIRNHLRLKHYGQRQNGQGDSTPPEGREPPDVAPGASGEPSVRLHPALFEPEALADYPAKLREFVRLVSDATQGALPLDWPVLMFLGAASILYPRVRIGGLPICTWVLGIGVQDMGKNLCSDAAVRCVRAARSIDLYTSGSPEGMIEQLAFGPALVYMAEFSGFLKTVSGRSYATGFREQLCDVYDGREVAHRRVKRSNKDGGGGGSVIVEHPYATFLTTTNAPSIREAATMADLTSGYLSRFAVIAADPSRPESFSGVDDVALGHLGRTLVAGDGYGPLCAVLGSTPDEAPLAAEILDALAMRLGFGRGAINLDEAAYGDPTPTIGRVVARAKKLAVLFELLESAPDLRPWGGFRDGGVCVRLDNVRRGVEWAERAHGWTLRVGSWLASGEDEALLQAIERALRKRPSTAREVMQFTRGAKSHEVQASLRMLQAGGRAAVTFTKNGQRGPGKEVWSWIGK